MIAGSDHGKPHLRVSESIPHKLPSINTLTRSPLLYILGKADIPENEVFVRPPPGPPAVGVTTVRALNE